MNLTQKKNFKIYAPPSPSHPLKTFTDYRYNYRNNYLDAVRYIIKRVWTLFIFNSNASTFENIKSSSFCNLIMQLLLSGRKLVPGRNCLEENRIRKKEFQSFKQQSQFVDCYYNETFVVSFVCLGYRSHTGYIVWRLLSIR